MNLKVEEQRVEPRVAVRFHAMVSGSVESEETGTILDLSTSGCRLESQLLMLPGFSLELRIAVPGLEWALMIDGADVQWADEDRAGLAFVQIRETERQQLNELVAARLAKGDHGGDDAQGELLPFEFQRLEAVLLKDPELAMSKGLAEAWWVKNESLMRWLTDERPAVTAFAKEHIAGLDRMIATERHRVEAERELRERSRHEDESGHDHGYRPKPF